MLNILVTGGAGYIGSHICLKLLENGFQPIVLDNFSNGHRDAVGDVVVLEGDIRDRAFLSECFRNHDIAAVIHLAGLIEAGASMVDPAPFYETNTVGSYHLLEAMRASDVRHMVFSSTAAMYGNHHAELLDETLPVIPINPYGKSKAAVEDMLADFSRSYGFRAIALRYFNAAGADPQGRAGERHDPETHLIPLALQAAAGQRPSMKIFGTDYDTADGTCIRDYIHVDDLAIAHLRALEWVRNASAPVFEPVNVGTGKGLSVREVLTCARTVSGVEFDIVEETRRPGDPDRLVADVRKAERLLGWRARYTDASDIIGHAWAYMMRSAPAGR